MLHRNGFENPFISIFRNELPVSSVDGEQLNRTLQPEMSFENNFQQDFEDDFRCDYNNNFDPCIDMKASPSDSSESSLPTTFHNEFCNKIPHNLPPNTVKTGASKASHYPPGHFKTLDDGSPAPQFLILRKRGLVDTELYDPLTDQVIYRTYYTGRGLLSFEPDIEFYRVSDGDMHIGSIRFGVTVDEIKCLSTQRSWANVNQFSLRQWFTGNAPRTLVWKTTKHDRDVKNHASSSKKGDDDHELWSQDLLIQELGDASRPGETPTCLSRLYNTLPMGRFEIWADNICTIEPGMDWCLLDEIVLSAYARLEKTRRSLIKDGGKNVYATIAESNMYLLPILSCSWTGTTVLD